MGANAEDLKTGEYAIYVNGYDWGPGIDKIILNAGKQIVSGKVQASDFIVEVSQLCMDWKSFSPRLMDGTRTVKKAYVSDSEGNASKKDSFITLELSVHPDDPFSNPFIFTKEMMNKWSEICEYKISNKKLGITAEKKGAKICPLGDQFEVGVRKTGNISLSYGAWNPSGAEKGKTPLIIWLHGMGEGGADPYIALYGNKVANLITPEIQNCFGTSGAVVLVPQTQGFWLQTTEKKSDMKSWASNRGTPDKSYYTEALFNLIDGYVKSNPNVDPSRIYIGGCSNGGYMTVNMILEYPEYFAAAFPICEAYPDNKIDESKLKILCSQNIWFTHAKNDKTVNPPDFTVATFERMKKAGAENVHFSFFEDVHDTTGNFTNSKKEPYQYNGHWSWIYTLTNQCQENELTIMEWLAGQRNEHFN